MSAAGEQEVSAVPAENCNPDEEELLSKLLQQNKLLEEDVRFTTRISSATSSTSSLPGTHLSTSDPSLRSHEQASWKNRLKKWSPKNTSSSSLRSTSSEIVENGSPDKPSPSVARVTVKDTPPSPLPNSGASSNGSPELRDVESGTPVPPAHQPSPSSSSSSPTVPLDSPTEVRGKPAIFPANEEDPASDEEGVGLGPAANIKLEDTGTRIPCHLVVQKGEEGGTRNLPDGGTHHLLPADEENQDLHDKDRKPSPAVSTSSLPKVDVANGEEQDVLSELPSATTVKLRRPRSETETRGTRISLIPFKSRKRSQTMQDTEARKDDQEEKPMSVEESQWQQWSDLLKNWEESASKNTKLVRHLTRQGVPEHLRGMAWQLLSNSHKSELKEQYPVLITESSPHERAIKRDLNRTFPEHPFFKERDGLGQESLLNVLKAYSMHDKEVGYCQGSPFIVGLLLMQMPEEEAFCVLVNLMSTYQLRDFYKPTMTDLSLCFYQLEKLIEETYPILSKHFKAVGFQTSIYASPWFLTMFASVLSLSVAFRVMDLVMVEGKEIIFRVGLALLESSQDTLVKMDMEDMMKYFQKGMRSLHEADPEQLIQKALKIKLHSKRMKKFAKEYLDKKARKALEITEMTRLQNENMEMNMKLSHVQQECESLAQQLISGRIESAQEAEAMLQLRRELAMARKKLEEVGRQGSAAQLGENKDTSVVSPERSVASAADHEESDNASEDSKLAKATNERSSSLPPLPQEVGVAEEGEGVGYWTQSSHSTLYKEGSSSPQSSPFIPRGHSTDSKHNLFQEGDTSEASPAPAQASATVARAEDSGDVEKKKKKKKKLLGRSKSDKKLHKVGDVQSEHVSPTLQPLDDKEGKKKKKKKDKKKDKELYAELVEDEDLERELAVAKTRLAECASQLEEKGWQCKQALQREKALSEEVGELTGHLTVLQAKLSKVNSTDLCSQCWSKIALSGEVEYSPVAPPTSAQDTGPLSSQALLTNLRAIWKSSPQSSNKELT